MSLPDILHNWNISIVTINSVGHGLETTIRKRNIVFAIGEVTISALLGTEVIVGVVILDSVLIGVDCRNISIAGLSIGGGGGVHWSRLVHDHGFVCDRSEILFELLSDHCPRHNLTCTCTLLEQQCREQLFQVQHRQEWWWVEEVEE